MERRKIKVRWLLILLFLAVFFYLLNQIPPILTAYSAKVLCSRVFISGLDPSVIRAEDLASYPFISTDVDRDGQAVEASLLGIARRKAVFRPALGCTLVLDTSEELLRRQGQGIPLPGHASQEEWPRGDLLPDLPLPDEIDRDRLKKALDDAFAEPDPEMLRRTRAVVVLYDGRLVAERYAPGISKDTPLFGWSMTKSVTGALAGILVGQGKLSLNAPAPVPEWQSPDDPRRLITLDQLLRMSSGLSFNEGYSNPFGDVPVMLFKSPDPAAYAADLPLDAPPNSKWRYSSGTTNIISRIIRHAVGGTLNDYLSFPRQALFNRIDMSSAVMEPSPSGNLVGSSFMYATARDWARFGLLHLQDGVWEGERILPEGWVDYCRTPTPAPPYGLYGAHWWLNTGANHEKRWLPNVPPDAYSARGFEGQFVTVVPSKKLVVVRLGLTKKGEAWDHDAFMAAIVDAVK